MKIKKYDEVLNESKVSDELILEGNKVDVNKVKITYEPVDEVEGIYMGGGKYYVQFKTSKGVFYTEVKKHGEDRNEDTPDFDDESGM